MTETRTDALQPGQKVFGKYKVEAKVGSGSYGEVYRVQHINLNSIRALKLLTRQMPGVGQRDFEECRQRFQLEARLGASLDHPNVVRVYDFLEEGDLLGLEMEYLAGDKLSRKIQQSRRQNQPIPIEEIVRIGSQAAEGLSAIHALGVVHRDLTPGNMLFDEQGLLKISDLGLAYLGGMDLSDREARGSLAERHPGTPRYMSPEQEQTSGHLTPASDVFALGLIIYEMLSGRNYKDCKPGTRPVRNGTSVPTWLTSLVMSMLSNDPARRPLDGTALSQEFNKHNGTTQPRPIQIIHQYYSWLVGIILVFVSIGALAGFWIYTSLPVDPISTAPAGFIEPPAQDQIVSRMTGDFRVAVAELSILGTAKNPQFGKELADGVFQRLDQTYAETDPGFSISIWGPDRVRSVQGEDSEARAQDAANLASEIGADILVYGSVDVTQPVWQVSPEFYISSDSFTQAAELNGPERLGNSFQLVSSDDTAARLAFSSQITPRINILARITVGLAYLSSRNYDIAIQQFQSVESLPEWATYENKEILYLLTGNAAMSAYNKDSTRADYLSMAEAQYRRSLEFDPEYARAIGGLAGIYYLKALIPYNNSKNPVDIDRFFLEQANPDLPARRECHPPAAHGGYSRESPPWVGTVLPDQYAGWPGRQL